MTSHPTSGPPTGPITAAPTDATFDVVVLGAGPAGTAAALVLGRARRDVLLLDGGPTRNACSPAVHGYPTRDGTAPGELLDLARSEVAGYGVRISTARATGVARTDRGWSVACDDGTTALARRVVVATGLTDHLPEVPGLAGRWGRDVLHCPYCHGYEQRDRALGVLAGDADGALHQALLLRQWSADVTLLLDGVGPLGEHDLALLEARGIRVRAGRVTGVRVEDDRLAGAEVGGADVPLDALFVPARFAVHTDALAGLDVATTTDDMGTRLTTDPEGRTSVAGIWAVGNVADLSAQVLGAAESGARAGIAINGELALEDAERALAARDGAVGAPR